MSDTKLKPSTVHRQYAKLESRRRHLEAELESLRRRCSHEGTTDTREVYGRPVEVYCRACRQIIGYE